MHLLHIVAQETNLPTGGTGQIIFWIIGAGTILALWFLISRTRKKSYNEYWERRRQEEERRQNDPDMAREQSSAEDDATPDSEADD